MSRRSDREARQARIAEDVMMGVFANWGIWPDDHTPQAMGHADMGEGFAAQIGRNEAVEYHEVYGLIRDVALEAYDRARQDGARSGAEEDYLTALGEVVRLRGIIAAAYGSQAWDIGTLKNALWPGLSGPLLPEILNATPRKPEPASHTHEWSSPMGRPRAVVCKCGASHAVAGPDSFATETCGLRFAPESSRDGWWLELYLIDDEDTERAVLILDDIDGMKLSDSLEQKIRQGRKDYS